MSDDLVKKALAFAKKGDEEAPEASEEDATGDCLKEAWDAMEAKDFGAFKAAFTAAVRVAVSEDQD